MHDQTVRVVSAQSNRESASSLLPEEICDEIVIVPHKKIVEVLLVHVVQTEVVGHLKWLQDRDTTL